MFFESCFLKHSLQKSNLLSEIPLLGGYIWLSTVNHAECVSNYNSLPFTFNKPDIKNLEEKKSDISKGDRSVKEKGNSKNRNVLCFCKKKKKKGKIHKIFKTHFYLCEVISEIINLRLLLLI